METAIAVVQRIEQVDPPPAAVVKVPAHQLALIGPGLLLNRVIKDQHAIIPLHRSDGRLDLLPKILGGVSWADKNRVIWSWLTSPSTIADKPVAVAAPKVLNKSPRTNQGQLFSSVEPIRWGLRNIT